MGSVNPAGPGQWFDEYAPALVLYARQWLDAAWAEDVVQEVFVRLMVQSVSPTHVKAWLFRAVRNEAVSRFRSLKRRESREDQRGREQPLWFQPQPGDRLDAQTAQSLLQSLPEDQREPVVLRIWGDLTLQEIADVLDLPLSTVYARYRSAMATLRQKMDSSMTGLSLPANR